MWVFFSELSNFLRLMKAAVSCLNSESTIGKPEFRKFGRSSLQESFDYFKELAEHLYLQFFFEFVMSDIFSAQL